MRYSLNEIAAALGAEVEGDSSITVTGAAEPADAGPDQIAIATSPKYAEELGTGAARVALLSPGAKWQEMGLDAVIFVPRPRAALAGLTAMIDPGQGESPGIHPTAVIDPAVELGDGVAIGPFAVIGARARIGAGAVIGAHCVIGVDAVLGPNAYLRDMVSIGARVQIGARFVAQPGARVGGDGFSYVTPEVSGVENARASMGDQGDATAQSWMRIHSLGAVSIGNDVEIGANSTIDNGTIRDTVVGNGTKIDSQVQVGHNVVIGADCLLCGHVGIAGSVQIGDNVVLGGKVGVADNISVGDRVIAAGGTNLLSNVPAGRVMMGYPAVKMDSFTETYKFTRRLPRIAREVAELKKVVFKNDTSE